MICRQEREKVSSQTRYGSRRNNKSGHPDLNVPIRGNFRWLFFASFVLAQYQVKVN
ncbi:hypothetical protein [cyanobacterium endosymbiont of Rhopalodia gibberula]|uniref:hypothetical protein n=1 Tax=cyanobacterium endosymbiont of Rhopalodia gibberula TaxID=1763363 RepID=UPI001558F77F|nr:hypothetical protein [cyanobacterium endosymbiont of Rhopalodia gibberula]